MFALQVFFSTTNYTNLHEICNSRLFSLHEELLVQLRISRIFLARQSPGWHSCYSWLKTTPTRILVEPFSLFNFDSYKKRNIRIASIIIVSFLTFSQFVIIVCPHCSLVSLSPHPRGGREGPYFSIVLRNSSSRFTGSSTSMTSLRRTLLSSMIVTWSRRSSTSLT